MSARPLNILWITLEDTSPRLGCYGDRLARTPNIDRLAAEGIRFPQTFATAGVCAPSRASIITGMYATSIGAHHMRTTHADPATPELPTPYEAVPPPYVKCFTEYMRAVGFYCTNNKKTDYQFLTPLTAWDECGDNAHWRNRESEQPFFAVFNPMGTHESKMWNIDEPLQTDPDAVTVPPWLPDTRIVRRTIAKQYDNLAVADVRVGELLRQLEEDGLADNTIVFLWSDHGEGLPRAKRWTYDAGIRVPMIVRWPGHPLSGSISDKLVSLIDLAPTVLTAVGLEPPLHMQGIPFVVKSGVAAEREYIYASRDRCGTAYDMVRAVRSQRFKYIRNFYPEKPYLLWVPYAQKHGAAQELWRLHAEGGLEGASQVLFQHPRPVEELYDCAADPGEVNNLAHDPPYRSELLKLRDELGRWRSQTGDMGDIPEAAMVEAAWPGKVQPVTAAPIFVPIRAGNADMSASSGGVFHGPLLLMLHSATQGASIAYTLESGDQARWKLYTNPLCMLPCTTACIRARAIRVGFKESKEHTAVFEVTEGEEVAQC